MVFRVQSQLSWVAWILIAGILAIDVYFPAGFAANLLYVGVILVGLWVPNPRFALHVAIVTTALSLGAFLLSAPPADPTIAYLNLAASLLVLWVTALGVTTYRRTAAAQSEQTTARRAAEVALGRSRKDIEDIKYALDQSAIVATTDVRGDITDVNDKFCEISKYDRDELIGRNHRILNSGLHPLEFFKTMWGTIGRGHVWRGEIRNLAKDGSWYWVDTTIVPFLDDRGHPYQYIAIRYDITERKNSEAELREQESLAQLGKMAAVVAHEVRNPLAGIRGALQVIGKRLGEGSREQAITNEIISRIDTLSAIVHDLLQFARPRQPVLAQVSLRGLLDETISLLREDPSLKDLEFHVDAAARLPADPEQLKLALLNLLMNSAQAMQGRGRIDISTRSDVGWVELRIADQGPGIPANVREHLFEPFFTTKHRGTGLGLATAKRILESHGGSLELRCPPEGGTIASLKLRAGPADGAPGRADGAPGRADGAPGLQARGEGK
jgi:PAS domain S-box-containing protein